MSSRPTINSNAVRGSKLQVFHYAGRSDFSTDFHNSFESRSSRKPLPPANLRPAVSIRDVHSNNNIVILDSDYLL